MSSNDSPAWRPHAPYVSVVIPTFDEGDNVGPLARELKAALDGCRRTYEVIFVDDGSADATPVVLRQLAETDGRLRVIRLRRNFGQTAAIQAGLDHSRGEVVVLMDGDGQNDPADIPRLLDRIDDGYDVVSGWRRERHDPLLSRRVPSRIANRLISWVTGVALNDYGCTLKAYRREVLGNVKLYGEMHRFIPAIASWAGATVAEMPVGHRPRTAGRSHYGISRTFRVLIDLITVKFLGSYSTKPSYIFGFLGLLLWFGGFLAGVVVLIELAVPPDAPAHRNPLLLLAVFLAILGAMCVMMGLLAELTIRTYHESQDKCTYVIRDVWEGGGQLSAAPIGDEEPAPPRRAASGPT